MRQMLFLVSLLTSQKVTQTIVWAPTTTQAWDLESTLLTLQRQTKWIRDSQSHVTNLVILVCIFLSSSDGLSSCLMQKNATMVTVNGKWYGNLTASNSSPDTCIF